MAKPRIFVSSTYYDLKHIRASLEAFIDSLGYDSVLFESGDIAFRHDKPLDQSCYQEIRSCHMLVLIIGGRYGSPASDEQSQTADEREESYKRFNSITRKEYATARERDIPIFMFVDKNVLAEHQTFKRNRDNEQVDYAFVDSPNIFHLLDEIVTEGRNNFVRGFENFDDISSWLRGQWAGLFAGFLSQQNSDIAISDLSGQIRELRDVSSVLRKYSEMMIKSIRPEDSDRVISSQHEKLWDAMIDRFATEKFIAILLSELPEDEFSCEEVFDHLLASPSIYDFFGRLGFNPDYVKEIGPKEEGVFLGIKSKYKDQASAIRIDDK